MIIPPGKTLNGIYYGEDIEAELADYMAKLRDIAECDTIYPQETEVRVKVDIPEDYDVPLDSKRFESYDEDKQMDIKLWWYEQKQRIKKGLKGMCGLQYKYFNFTKLHGGKGATAYRRHDNWMFKLIESCCWGDLAPWGILELGRRRFGKSSRIGCFSIEAISRVSGGTIIMTSKTEDDAQRILIGEKIKYQYDKLPYPLKPSTLKSSMGQIHFGMNIKDEAGNPKIGGLDSKIVGKTPKETAIEGSTLIGWIHDEAPKTPNFGDLVQNTLPALADADGFNREGFAYLTGVAGDFGKHGNDFITVWNSAEKRQLLRVFTPGWLGGKTDAEIEKQKARDRKMAEIMPGFKVEDLYLRVDEFLNEDIAYNVRTILRSRASIMSSKTMNTQEKEEMIRKVMQQYPLTVEEALRSSTLSKWNTDNIDSQVKYLNENPPIIYRADLEWEIKKIKVRMKPKSHSGQFRFLEPPVKGAKYIAGADTFGFKQTELGSVGVQWIYKLENNLLSPGEKENVLRKISISEDPEERLKLYLHLGGLPVGLHISKDSNPRHFAEDMVLFANWFWTRSESDREVKILVETEPSNALDYLLKDYKNYTMNSPLRADKIATWAEENQKFGLVKKEYWLEQMMEEIAHYINHKCGRIFFPELLELMKTYDETSKTKKYDEVDAFGNTLIMSVDHRIVEWNNAPEVPKVEEVIRPLFGFKRT